MHKSLLLTASKCTGCRQCEMACSFEKEGSFNPAKSRIRIFDLHADARFVPYTCTQCTEAWCMHACPVNSIQIEASTGAKVVHEDLCVGCKVCTIACPFGTVNYNADSGVVDKCDLCHGNPACAKACPTGAITFVDSEQTGYEKMKMWAAKTDNDHRAEA